MLKCAQMLRKLAVAAKDLLTMGYLHTHERVDPDFPSENFVNHFKVYKFIAQFCSPGNTVLDIGCGTGYGTAYLAEHAAKVYGMDISASALRFARSRYSRPNVIFQKMDAQHLSFPDRSFDLTVSTENFEHLVDQSGAAREMARVLKPDGICFVATPNPEAFTTRNPFHTHECTYEELRDLLGSLFGEVVILENSLSSRKDRGVIATAGFALFNKPLDLTHLSNTHSFFCFCRPVASPSS